MLEMMFVEALRREEGKVEIPNDFTVICTVRYLDVVASGRNKLSPKIPTSTST